MSKNHYRVARTVVALLGGAIAFLVTYILTVVIGVAPLYRLLGAGLYGLLVTFVGWLYMRSAGAEDDGEN